ncbi:MAG: NAD(P)H-hydrate dehydratase [Lachnospira sp.]|nr:NAD(P)H-hydrate dehydratase [Lachnospira sp.]
MKYILDAKQMKAVDDYSIKKIGIPSVVLMERAALAVAEVIEQKCDESAFVAVVCGTGNNGADGLAIARLLSQKGYAVDIILTLEDKKHSDEYDIQLNIVKNMGLNIYHNSIEKEYTIIVDAIFGIGLSRNVDGNVSKLIDDINNANAFKVAVDVPSGINATTGKVCGNAVKADITVTFGYNKLGMLLYPGKMYAGKLVCKDIGFVADIDKNVFTLEKTDLINIPKKKEYSNKGSYEKVLIVAGSDKISGALTLSTMAAYRSGASYVKVYTHKANELIIKQAVPEAIVTVYEKYSDEEFAKMLDWAKVIVIGPGISTDENAIKMVKATLTAADKNVIADADAINIIANNTEILTNSKANVILTPHLLEASRLMGVNINEIKDDIMGVAQSISDRFNAICVLKDAYTVVANSQKKVYINEVGNAGMAKAGSGDVLAGIIAGLLSNKIPLFDAACYGVFTHSLAGIYAAEQLGEYSMKPTDVIANLSKVFNEGMNGE